MGLHRVLVAAVHAHDYLFQLCSWFSECAHALHCTGAKVSGECGQIIIFWGEKKLLAPSGRRKKRYSKLATVTIFNYSPDSNTAKCQIDKHLSLWLHTELLVVNDIMQVLLKKINKWEIANQKIRILFAVVYCCFSNSSWSVSSTHSAGPLDRSFRSF